MYYNCLFVYFFLEKSLFLFISLLAHLPPPKVTMQPKFFSVGGNYTVYCDSTLNHATNFSMSLYYRTLPVTPQTTLFHLGSLNLTGTNNRIFVTQTNANIQVEYVCTMKMLYNGKVLHSPLSNFEAAIPGKGEQCIV